MHGVSPLFKEVFCLMHYGCGARDYHFVLKKKKEKGEGRNGSIITLPTENKGISLFALTSEWESFF